MGWILEEEKKLEVQISCVPVIQFCTVDDPVVLQLYIFMTVVKLAFLIYP